MYLTRNTAEKCIMARVMRRKQMYQRNFSVKEYGTWKVAARAAQHWIAETLPKLPAKMDTTHRGVLTRRNHSGVVGVHWTRGLVKNRQGRVYQCPRWIAKWPGCPNHGGISWMEKQWEHEGAFVLAVLSRRLETVNRDNILREFETILGTKELDEIVNRMRM